MLVIDGVKYRLWTPKDEEKEFHPMIEEHCKEIFGENRVYFDVKQKLISRSGIGSIPDAYVIKLSKPYEWYVIENELASHSIYDHIVKQLTKFMNGLRNPESRSNILEAIDEKIQDNENLKAHIKEKIGSAETYRFMSKLFSRSPKIVVVIDKLNEEVKEACQSLKYDIQFVEFRTFVRESGERLHAHLFEPLYSMKAWETRKLQEKVPVEEHFNKIKNEKIRKMAIELRDAIKSVSGDIREGTTSEHITFWTDRKGKLRKFCGICPEKKAFEFQVKIPRSEFNIKELDARENGRPKWTFILVDERTDLTLLIEASRQAYERTKRNV